MSFRFCPDCGHALVEGTHGERTRMGCKACGWVHWESSRITWWSVIIQELDRS